MKINVGISFNKDNFINPDKNIRKINRQWRIW